MQKIDEATLMTMAIINSDLMNEPDVCIKDFGSTLMCVCDKCNSELFKEIIKREN